MISTSGHQLAQERRQALAAAPALVDRFPRLIDGHRLLHAHAVAVGHADVVLASGAGAAVPARHACDHVRAEAGNSQAGDDRAPVFRVTSFDVDHAPQGSNYKTNSANFLRSMLPPEMTATMGPSPALPLSAAATASAPAPSAMTRTFSATRRIARRTSSSETTIEPSTMPCIRSHIRGKMLLPPAPSTNEACQFMNCCGPPFSNDSAPGAAVSGSAPRTRTCGASWRTALPMPEISPPPPMAAITVFTLGRSSRISMPRVAVAAMKSCSSKG